MPIPSEGDLTLRHIALDGPIGVGKTSLCEMLARRFHGTKVLEDVDNPFLGDFYKKKKGSPFQTQLFFLLARYQQQREIAQIDLFTTLVVADYHFPRTRSSRT
jgi:deoxyadenosine/deoxycytidine kinase